MLGKICEISIRRKPDKLACWRDDMFRSVYRCRVFWDDLLFGALSKLLSPLKNRSYLIRTIHARNSTNCTADYGLGSVDYDIRKEDQIFIFSFPVIWNAAVNQSDVLLSSNGMQMRCKRKSSDCHDMWCECLIVLHKSKIMQFTSHKWQPQELFFFRSLKPNKRKKMIFD